MHNSPRHVIGPSVKGIDTLRLLKFVALAPVVLTTILAGLVFLTGKGLLNPYPDPPDEVMSLPHFGRSADIPFAETRRRTGESMKAYEDRLNAAISAWMVHYWPDDRKFVEVNPLVSPTLWWMSRSPGYEHFANYEFLTPEAAWLRGYGFCSQVARLLFSLLRREGANPAIVQNDMHTVVEVDGRILDADYGVVVPHTAAYMQANPALVERYYADFRSSWPLLKKVYAAGLREVVAKEVFAHGQRFEEEAAKIGWLVLLAMWSASMLLAFIVSCWPRLVSSYDRESLPVIGDRG